MPLQRFNQGWQKRNQSLRANLIGRGPGQVECLLDFWSVARQTRTLYGKLEIYWMVQKPDGVFAGISCCGDKLVNDDLLEC